MHEIATNGRSPEKYHERGPAVTGHRYMVRVADTPSDRRGTKGKKQIPDRAGGGDLILFFYRPFLCPFWAMGWCWRFDLVIRRSIWALLLTVQSVFPASTNTCSVAIVYTIQYNNKPMHIQSHVCIKCQHVPVHICVLASQKKSH